MTYYFRTKASLRESEKHYKAFLANDARLLEFQADVYMHTPRNHPVRDDPFVRFQAAKETSAIFIGVVANVFLVVATLASCTTNAVKLAFSSASAEAVELPKAELARYKAQDNNKPVVNVVVDNAAKRPKLKSKVFMNRLNQ